MLNRALATAAPGAAGAPAGAVGPHRLEVAGLPFIYATAGEGGRTLLYLSGALDSGGAVAAFAASVFPGWRVLEPDWPRAATVAELVAGLVAILDREGASRAAVLGGSYGGVVAQCLVRQHPQRVDRLVLSGTGFPEPKRAAANRRFLKVLPRIPMAVLRGLLRTVLRLALRHAPQRQRWREVYFAAVARLERADLTSRYRVSIDFDEHPLFAPEDLSAWPGKILLLEGGEDRIAGARVRDGMRALYPQAERYTFAKGGHAAALTHPDEWARVVRGFLAG